MGSADDDAGAAAGDAGARGETDDQQVRGARTGVDRDLAVLHGEPLDACAGGPDPDADLGTLHVSTADDEAGRLAVGAHPGGVAGRSEVGDGRRLAVLDADAGR